MYFKNISVNSDLCLIKSFHHLIYPTQFPNEQITCCVQRRLASKKINYLCKNNKSSTSQSLKKDIFFNIGTTFRSYPSICLQRVLYVKHSLFVEEILRFTRYMIKDAMIHNLQGKRCENHSPMSHHFSKKYIVYILT